MTKPSTLNDILLHTTLIEDLGFPFRDVTTDLLFPGTTEVRKAIIVSKHATPMVICGIDLTRAIFSKLADPNIFHIHSDYQDGEILPPGKTLLTIEAPAPILLKGERIALNFLRHLCAIATLTARYVERVKHTSLRILDTRKTTPGSRHLEKYAVHCGGGVNHRMGLYDAIMLKDTHIDLLGGIQHAMARLQPLAAHGLPVIVEVRSFEELNTVLETGREKVTRVLLDNMLPDLLCACVTRCQNLVETEASGNIGLETIAVIAETGVNYASVGELTYNAGHVDLSMYIVKSSGI